MQVWDNLEWFISIKFYKLHSFSIPRKVLFSFFTFYRKIKTNGRSAIRTKIKFEIGITEASSKMSMCIFFNLLKNWLWGFSICGCSKMSETEILSRNSLRSPVKQHRAKPFSRKRGVPMDRYFPRNLYS